MHAANKNRQPVVLVVEDEIWVLLDVAGALEEQGYLVLCARNGDEALSLFEDRNDIGILFTDIAMPGSLNGLDLAREVRRRRPDVGVLVTSGHYRKMDGDIDGCDFFIPKPYEPRIVISRIGSLVDSHTGQSKSGVSTRHSVAKEASLAT